MSEFAWRNWQLLNGIPNVHTTPAGVIEQYDSSYEAFKVIISDWNLTNDINNPTINLQVNGDTNPDHYYNQASDNTNAWIKLSPVGAGQVIKGFCAEFVINVPLQDGSPGSTVIYFNGTATYCNSDPATLPGKPGFAVFSWTIAGFYALPSGPLHFNPFFNIFASNGPINRGHYAFYGLSTRGATTSIQ